MDRINRRAEACDSLAGFIIISSMGGGTSSGLGNCVSVKIKESYPGRITQSFKLLPDASIAHPLEIYNSAHSI
jgi:cell division GTPase FtsZ